MSSNLQIGSGLELPLSAVTQTYGLLGKRGVGKTNGAVVLAEELLERGMQVVMIDPVGVWWGIRSSADGKADGYPVLIMGGDHADVPLEAGAGKLVADFVVGKRASVVLDLGAMSKTDQSRFVAEFLERLYQKNRDPLQLIIDEADAFAPQRIHRGGERCFGAVDTAVRRGRARGIGVTLVTQRSAAINKDVLTQIEVLIVFRTLAPQDRAAVEAWVEVHGDQAKAKELLHSLHELKVGECWVWSPAWLERLSRVQIRRRRTFDSSATPEAGKTVRAPKAIAAVDVQQFRTELSALIEKAEIEDPRRLRARVAELERQLMAKPAAIAPAPKVKTVKVPAISEKDIHRLESVALRCEALAKAVLELVAAATLAGRMSSAASGTFEPIGASVRREVMSEPTLRVDPATIQRPTRSATISTAGLGKGAVPLDRASRAILTVLAQNSALGGCSASRLTLLAGYRWSGGFRNALSALRSAGYISGANSGVMEVTAEGLRALGPVDPLPTGEALRQYWLTHHSLGAAERAVLKSLIEAHPRALTSDEVMRATGYAWSGGFRNALSKLRTAGLLEGRNSEAMLASRHLFSGRGGA